MELWGRRIMTTFCVALVVVTVLGWFGSLHPLLESLTNVPVGLLLLAVVGFVATALARLRWHAMALALVVAWFVWLLAPYVLASPDQRVADATDVTALQYNVYFENDDFDSMVALIETADADVVALHEVTTDQLAELEEQLDGYGHLIGEPWDGPEPQLGGGLAIFSRTPLERIEIGDAASPLGRPILAASTEVNGAEIVVVGLHPHASRFEGDKIDLRERQFDAVADLLRNEPRPAVLLTDMNVTPTSPAYRGLLDDLGWRDIHRSAGWDASWPSFGGWLGLPIDHVLVSDNVAVHAIDSVGTGGSDHRALRAELSIPPAG